MPSNPTVEIEITWGVLPVKVPPTHFRSTQSWDKGNGLVRSGHVRNVKEYKKTCLITALCLPETNVNDKEYQIKINFDKERKFISAVCSCKAGVDGKCKHVAGTLYYINDKEELSKTSLPQQWGLPSTKKAYKEATRISALFPMKNDQIKIEEVQLSVLNSYEIECPLAQILQASSITVDDHEIRLLMDSILQQVEDEMKREKLMDLLQEMLANPSNDFRVPLPQLSEQLQKYYNDSIALSRSEIAQVSNRTKTQANEKEWFKVRKSRVSSTKFHSIFVSRRSAADLVKFLMDDKIITTPAMEYGKKTEDKAREHFSLHHGTKIIESGVIVSPQRNWMCASPDGILREKDGSLSLLEIKCPFSCKKKKLLDKTGKEMKCNVGYLKVVDGKIVLQETNAYFTQMQVAMYCTGLKLCHFYVYTSVEQVHLTIPYNSDFISKRIPKVEKFYFEHYLPNLFEVTKDQ